MDRDKLMSKLWLKLDRDISKPQNIKPSFQGLAQLEGPASADRALSTARSHSRPQ